MLRESPPAGFDPQEALDRYFAVCPLDRGAYLWAMAQEAEAFDRDDWPTEANAILTQAGISADVICWDDRLETEDIVDYFNAHMRQIRSAKMTEAEQIMEACIRG
jgi:hypothetical protein